MSPAEKIREAEREIAVLQPEAAQVVALAEAQNRALTGEEDSYVLGLLAHVRALEETVEYLTRHRWDRTDNSMKARSAPLTATTDV